MRMFLDNSNNVTILELDNEHYEWNSGHDLARDLLSFIHDKLIENNADWEDLSEIHFVAGPGSFTGLRIGATVVNTLADQLKIPLFNQRGEKVDVIMPEYGREANISKPRK